MKKLLRCEFNMDNKFLSVGFRYIKKQGHPCFLIASP